MPAMPPPERPCGRTEAAGKCSSWASLVMKVSSSDSLVSSTAPTTRSPALEPDDLPGVAPSTSALTRLTTPRAVPSASPSEVSASVVRQSTRSPASRVTSSETWVPPCRLGALAVDGTVGRSSALILISRPARGDHAEIAAGGAEHRGDDHVVVGPRAARRQRVGVVGPGQQAGRGQQHPARVVGDLQRRGGGRRGHAAGGQQDGPTRGPVLLGDLGQLVADQRAQLLGVLQDLGQLGDGRLQRVPLGLQLEVENLVSRRSGISRM